MSALPGLTLVTGGAASGKSAWAEALVAGSAQMPHYMATGRAEGAEMTEKIARHRAMRGPGWITVEAGADAAARLAGLPARALLFDCATLWLAAVMEAGLDVEAEVAAFAHALAHAPYPCAVVTNELGHGMVPMDAGARAFRDAHGRMNQALAARASLVVLVACGLPLALKGALPEADPALIPEGGPAAALGGGA